MRVVFDDAALDDLERIYAWIAKDDPRAAARVVDRVFSSVEVLGTFPRLGRVGRRPGTYEWIVPDLLYIVVFQLVPEEDELRVTAVFHGAQDR